MDDLEDHEPAETPQHSGRFSAFAARLGRIVGYEPNPEIDEYVVADQARRWTTRAIVTATLTLALLNAPSIQTWAATLSPDWGSGTISALADVWAGRLAQIGLDRPRSEIHNAYQAGKALSWQDLRPRRRRSTNP